MRKNLFLINPLIVLLILTTVGYAQDAEPQPTPPDTDITVDTEEIKLNISAVTNSGYTASGLTVKDVVIMENGRLHQATSVRKIPANVLILLDVGNEISYAKRSKTTSATALNLVNYLQIDDSVAVMQYGDTVEVLSDLTNDRNKLNEVLKPTKLGFGKYSRFNLAMETAIDYFDKTPLENRHLIVIGDGVDSLDNLQTRRNFTKRLLSSDINVHVVSYTFLQTQSIKGKKVTKFGNAGRPNRIPPEANNPGLPQNPTGGTVTINLDREMIKHRKKEMQKLLQSEKFLTDLARDTNGEIFIPETTDEMVDQMAKIAKYIDSQYVVTYIPNNSLAKAPEGEVRNISVTSKKSGVFIQSKRRYVVSKAN